MSNELILAQIIKIIQKNTEENKKINELKMTMDTLVEEINMNSLEFIQTVVDIEQLFEFEFEDEKLTQGEFEHLSDLVKYIQFQCERDKQDE